jgi:predicted DNA-binding ribbon-helix-helix protein
MIAFYPYSVWIDMNKKPLSLRIEEGRLEKLKRIAEARKKTMTQLIEEWIDKLKEEKPS